MLLLSLLVLFGGAAGMYNFEDMGPGTGFDSFGAALWWTAMILVTMGSDFWPRSPEGRLLCLLIAVYGYSVFGYLTATLASLFIASDAARGGPRERP